MTNSVDTTALARALCEFARGNTGELDRLGYKPGEALNAIFLHEECGGWCDELLGGGYEPPPIEADGSLVIRSRFESDGDGADYGHRGGEYLLKISQAGPGLPAYVYVDRL